jgi:MFS family permease
MSSTLGLEVKRHGHSETVFGWILALNGILIVVLELPLNVWARRFPTPSLMAFGFVLCGVGFGMNGLGGSVGLYLLAMTVFTLGEMLSLPVGAAYVAELAPAELRGRYLGANGLTWALALIVGPTAGTSLFEWNPDSLWLATALCGALAAGIIAGGRPRPR